MSHSSDTTFIGFPPPLLGFRPQRLPVIWQREGGFAVAMPNDVQILMDNWYPRTPMLAESINYQAAQGKPELDRLGVTKLGVTAIYTMEPDLSGVALFATTPEMAEFWRNAYGSDAFSLRIQFVAEAAPADPELDCELPIARHSREKRSLVSHSSGKKAQTHFRRLERMGRFSLWEATTHFYRMHQLPLHASEVGISILGDTLYARSRPLFLSELKRSFRPAKRKEETPLYEGLAMHLASLTVPLSDADEPVTIEAPPPSRFAVLLKRLRDFG